MPRSTTSAPRDSSFRARTSPRRGLDSDKLETIDAGPDDRVTLAIAGIQIPVTGDYVVRLTARLDDGVLASRVRFETDKTASAVEDVLRRGELPGKVGGSYVVLPIGRLHLESGVDEELIISTTAPGVIINHIELVGPVGDRPLRRDARSRIDSRLRSRSRRALRWPRGLSRNTGARRRSLSDRVWT